MQLEPKPQTSQVIQLFPEKPALRSIFLFILFITAFGVRLYHIDRPLLEFHVSRQYRSALIARGYYYETLKSIPEWKRHVAILNMQKRTKMEPSIMEFISCLGYRIIGEERLWIPRLLASIFWLIGGVFLYLLAKKMVSEDAAVISAAIYLFIPFGILASRSFQPDPMMIMMLIISVFLIFWYYEQPSISRLLLASVATSAALFIKPVCLPFIFGAFLLPAIYKRGVIKSVINPHFVIFVLVGIMPVVIYYSYGIYITGSRYKINPKGRILPHILLDPSYWKGVNKMIKRVIGYYLLMPALFGILAFRKKLSRALLIGLWVAYPVYCFMFTYTILSQDYYHLPLIPVVALSLGPLIVLVMNLLRRLTGKWRWIVLVSGILLLAISFNSYKSQAEARRKRFKSDIVRIAPEIGEAVGHSTNTIFLAYGDGKPLMYYGYLIGNRWPSLIDLRAYRILGFPEFTIEERFNTKYSSPEYFIVTRLEDFKKQPDLKEFLTTRFPILVRNEDYLIFDLRKR